MLSAQLAATLSEEHHTLANTFLDGRQRNNR